MDRREEELLRSLDDRRSHLIHTVAGLDRSVRAVLDPREELRRDPLGGTLACLGLGILFGALIPRPRRGQSGPRPDAGGEPPDLGFATALLPSVLPALLSLLSRTGRDRSDS